MTCRSLYCARTEAAVSLIYFGRLVGVWCHGDDTIGPDAVEPTSTCPFLPSIACHRARGERFKKCLLVTAGLPVNVKQWNELYVLWTRGACRSCTARAITQFTQFFFLPYGAYLPVPLSKITEQPFVLYIKTKGKKVKKETKQTKLLPNFYKHVSTNIIFCNTTWKYISLSIQWYWFCILHINDFL
jgi:hypothetical protein